MLHYSTKLCAGLSPGWTQTGGMFIASTEERLDEYKRLATIGKFFECVGVAIDWRLSLEFPRCPVLLECLKSLKAPCSTYQAACAQYRRLEVHFKM